MKKHLFLYAVAVTALLIFSFRHYRLENLRLTQNQTALASEISRYRTRAGEEAASAQVLRLRCAEFEELRAADAARIKALGIKLRRVEATAKTATTTLLELRAGLRDTIILRSRSGTGSPNNSPTVDNLNASPGRDSGFSHNPNASPDRDSGFPHHPNASPASNDGFPHKPNASPGRDSGFSRSRGTSSPGSNPAIGKTDNSPATDDSGAPTTGSGASPSNHSVSGSLIADTLQLFRWRDTWTTVEGLISDDSVACRIESTDTLRQVVHRIPRRFLFIRWGTKALRQEILSSNPHTRIVFSEYVKIEKRGK